MLIALLSVLGPLGGGVVAWWAQSRIEQNRREAERLHSERAKLYLLILQPIADIFGNPTDDQAAQIMETMTSDAFRNAMFQVNLIGSDRAITAINKMYTYFYQRDDNAPYDPKELVAGLNTVGDTMLAIRKDLGNRKTKLEPLDMLRSRIKDLETLGA